MTLASGIGLATLAGDTVLEVWYPAPDLGDDPVNPGGLLEREDDVRGVRSRVVTTTVDLDQPPTSTADAYLRLHLLSHRLVRPNEANLDGLFGILPSVVWTTMGPCPQEGFEVVRARLRSRGHVSVVAVDKFPRMLDYVAPEGVRVADASRVRLGAHLAPGTTVMHAGFVNFNAGTLGTSMVEGRISQGVVVGDGSDIGGGASIMGTLSGGGRERVSIGESCLLGANAGLGIALGDNCVVEAGLYVTAGTKVALAPGPGGMPRDQFPEGPRVVSARELSGHSNLLFRRNSISGAVEALPRRGRGIELNAALHA